MEDILASIRRIIADEEPAGQETAAGGDPQAAGRTQAEGEGRGAEGGAIRVDPRNRGMGAPVQTGPAASRYSASGQGRGSVRSPDEAHQAKPDFSAQASSPAVGATDARKPSEEEVFDLTDEFIFADQPKQDGEEGASESAPAPAGSKASFDPPHRPDNPSQVPNGAQRAAASVRGGLAEQAPGFFDMPRDKQGPDADARTGHDMDLDRKQDSRTPPKPAGSVRSLWSRREMPASQQAPASRPFSARTQPAPGPRDASPPPPRPSSLTQPATPAQRWSGDFQAPVPEDGPRPLFGERQLQSEEEPRRDGWTGEGATSLSRQPEIEEAAGQLARNAVTALDDDELNEVRRVDFSALDEARKKTVAQSFAVAVDRAVSSAASSSPQTPPADPHLAAAEPEVPETGWEQPEEERPPEVSELEETPDAQVPAIEAGGQLPPFVHPQSDAGDEPVEAPRAIQPPRQPELTVPAVPTVAPPIVSGHRAGSHIPRVPDDALEAPPPQAFLQSQAAPPAKPSPSGGGTLEDSVREMLRPLLAGWLNENMPRILEDAIRKEISARGLVPSKRDE